MRRPEMRRGLVHATLWTYTNESSGFFDPEREGWRNDYRTIPNLGGATMNKKLISHAIQASILGSTLAIPQFTLSDKKILKIG